MSFGTPGLFFSIEKPVNMIYVHFVSLMFGIPYSKIRHIGDRKLDKEEAATVERFQNQVRDLPLIINDNQNLTINELCYESQYAFKDKNIKIIYIDCLGLIRTRIIKTEVEGENLATEVLLFATAIRKLKALAQELNIPIVVNDMIYR